MVDICCRRYFRRGWCTWAICLRSDCTVLCLLCWHFFYITWMLTLGIDCTTGVFFSISVCGCRGQHIKGTAEAGRLCSLEGYGKHSCFFCRWCSLSSWYHLTCSFTSLRFCIFPILYRTFIGKDFRESSLFRYSVYIPVLTHGHEL